MTKNQIATKMASLDFQADLIAEASRAPSVHNVQPAMWGFEPEKNKIHLYADSTRRLKIADPLGHDHEVSLGAAYEGTKIALSRHGLSLSEPTMRKKSEWDSSSSALVASGEVGSDAEADPLAHFVAKRATFRGAFAETRSQQRKKLKEKLSLLHPENAVLITKRNQIEAIAEVADTATETFMADAAYRNELMQWLRLSPNHPNFARDGLNSDALALSNAERALSMLVMRPRVMDVLTEIGVAKLLTSERAKAVTAGAIVLFTAPLSETPFQTGRNFYRLWLAITAVGFAACPVSALADDPSARDFLCTQFKVSRDQRLVNVFRVGIRPNIRPSETLLTPRLPAHELLRKVFL